MAKKTGQSRRIGLIRGRFQKFNPLTGLFDKYHSGGNYLSTKKTGDPFKSIITLKGRNPHRP